MMRSRWAAVGAAVAVTLGAGGIWAAHAVTASGTPAGFEPLTPARILDTRHGIGAPLAPIGPNKEIVLQVTGVGGVPADATAVVLNMTSADGTSGSFVTVYPDGETRPDSSALNVQPGIATPNMITAKLGAGGKLRIFNFAGSVNVIADVAGYFHPVAAPTQTTYGQFDNQGTLQGGNIGINMPRQNVGFYKSTSGGNFPNCTYTVSVNTDNAGTARYAIVDRGAFPTWIYVYTYNAAGTLVDSAFTLAEYCPPS
jgi:hypothetical protein